MWINFSRVLHIGSDHTLFALKEGKVKYGRIRKTHFDGKIQVKKTANVISK